MKQPPKRKALNQKGPSNIKLPVFDLQLRPGIDPTKLNALSEELALKEDLERYLRCTEELKKKL